MSKRTDIIDAIDHLDEFRQLALDLGLFNESGGLHNDDWYMAVVNMRKWMHDELRRIEHELLRGKDGTPDT